MIVLLDVERQKLRTEIVVKEMERDEYMNFLERERRRIVKVS